MSVEFQMSKIMNGNNIMSLLNSLIISPYDFPLTAINNVLVITSTFNQIENHVIVRYPP